MRVIVAGGGTGGHLFPGIAVAQEFKRRDAANEILFVGTAQGIEVRAVPAAGFPLELIPVKGLKGRGVHGLLQGLYGIPASFVRSLGILRRFRPDYVLGVGGYASGPLLLAAKTRRVRTAILEENLRPGLTNEVLAKLVDRVFTSYQGSAKYFPRGRVVETGNPVRWRKLPEVEREKKFMLFIFGGSQGARRINQCAIDMLKRLGDMQSSLKILHQTGKLDYESVRAAYEELPFEAAVVPFIDAMDQAYASADLVICRSGAATIAELTVFGKPAILIPYPYAVYDHQRLNAEELVEKGAAEMILDRELDGEKLAARVRALFEDRARLAAMAAAAKRLGRPDAAERIVEESYALVRG